MFGQAVEESGLDAASFLLFRGVSCRCSDDFRRRNTCWGLYIYIYMYGMQIGRDNVQGLRAVNLQR